MKVPKRYRLKCLTRSLLLAVASDSADNGVLLSTEAVGGAFSVTLGLGGLVLGLALGVLFTAGLGPRLKASGIADSLDDVALGGVVLTGGLAVDNDAEQTISTSW
jgi:hypothetical protein